MFLVPYQVRFRTTSADGFRPKKTVFSALLALLAALIALPALAFDHGKLVIASLDGRPVTGADFEPYLRPYLRSKLYHSGSPERIRELAGEALEAYLVDRVLAQQAAERKVDIDKAEVDKRIADISSRYGSRPEWPEIRDRLPKLRQEIETDLSIEGLKREISRVTPAVEADVRAYYVSKAELFTRPAGYRLKLLLIAVEPSANAETWLAAEEQARGIARRIAAGESFSTFARDKSKHASAGQGGALGLVHEGQLGEAADAALRGAKPNDIVGPVRLLEGIALFEVEEKRAPELQPFPDAKERAAVLLERDLAKKQWSRYLDTIRQRFSIDEAALSQFLASAIK